MGSLPFLLFKSCQEPSKTNKLCIYRLPIPIAQSTGRYMNCAHWYSSSQRIQKHWRSNMIYMWVESFVIHFTGGRCHPTETHKSYSTIITTVCQEVWLYCTLLIYSSPSRLSIFFLFFELVQRTWIPLGIITLARVKVK